MEANEVQEDEENDIEQLGGQLTVQQELRRGYIRRKEVENMGQRDQKRANDDVTLIWKRGRGGDEDVQQLFQSFLVCNSGRQVILVTKNK